MLNKTFWKKVFKAQSDFDISRRKIIGESSRSLHLAKQSIFALHRSNAKDAKEKLADSKAGLISLDKRFGKDFRLRGEGSWKAAVEEYVEAKLFSDFIAGKKIGEIKDFNVEADEFIGGLSDLTGEIVRKMIYWVTKGEIKKAEAANEVINEIVYDLMQNNLTGYLRNKLDQAKKGLQKSESILYDIKIRKL
jgi:predicted translin family RNA/ssDNA-binding protein